MGKRSDFDRKDKDFYVTPIEAIEPLIPHLPVGVIYDDPCYGTGAIPLALIASLCTAACLYRNDLYAEAFGIDHVGTADARTHKYSTSSKMFITNPPWDRSKKNGEILHKIIDNLAGQKPTWLLFDASWCHTRQSSPFMEYCHKIVSVGRIKWFPESKMAGKDDCAWYLFDKNTEMKGTLFYGRR